MKKLIVVMLILFFSGTAWGGSPSSVLGIGNTSCGEFLKGLNDNLSINGLVYGEWLNGYMTALNKRTDIIYDISGDISIDSRMLLVKYYCEKNPLETFYRAVINLCVELENTGKVIKTKP